MTSILVAVSAGFHNFEYIARGVGSLLPSYADSKLTLIADSERELIKALPPLMQEPAFIKVSEISRRKAASLIKENEACLVFWDGRSLTELIYQSRLQSKPIKVIPLRLTLVANKDREEPFDVYIGRGSPWGNPFPVGVGEGKYSREEAIEKFKAHFEQEVLSDPSKVKALKGMRGLTLGCHCKPLACHGDVIAKYLNDLPFEDD